MQPNQIIENVLEIWLEVQKEYVFPPQLRINLECFLNQTAVDASSLKKLGTDLYHEVSLTNFPDGDARRDGIRAMSHFVMAYWELISNRAKESNKRSEIALSNMRRYINRRNSV